MDDIMDTPPEEVSEYFEEMIGSSMYYLIRVEPDAEHFIEIYTHMALAGYFDFFDDIAIDDLDQKRIFFRMIAIQIWNHTPLPSNHYRPKPIPKPGRNASCFCGSGLKYKHCCARMDIDELPIMHQGMLTHFLLETISKTRLKQVWQFLPHPVLAETAVEWARESEEQAERALLMLDPIFKQDDSKLDHRDEMAFDTMMDLCTLLDKPRKKKALVKRLMQHPDKVLRSAALQRWCCILGDLGQDDEAWQYFQQAQRLDPDDPALSHLELILLMQQGKTDLMQQRGKFWIKRLGNMNHDGDLSELIDSLRELISDTPSMLGNLLDRTIPGISRLISWLNTSSQTPPPLINKLKKSGTYRIIEPTSKQTAGLEYEWTKLMMDSDDPWQQSKSWLDMLEENPELAGSSVVLDDLIRIIHEVDIPNATLIFEPLLILALFQIKRLLPNKPEVQVPWGFLENRPALRVLGFLGQTMAGDDPQTPLELMEWLLRLNPQDNQGIRSDLINGYLHLHRDQDAITLCQHYPEDIDVNICYGHALALFRLGQQQPASTHLKLAIDQSPRVAKAILRKSMKQPKGMEPGYFTLGGEDEAWYYHQEARNLWLDTPGAMAWIKKSL